MAWCGCTFVVALFAVALPVCAEPLTLDVVLDRVDASQAASRQFHMQGQTLGSSSSSLSGETTLSRSRIDMFVDGDRLDMTSKSWQLASKDIVPADRDAECRREIWDGKTYYSDMWNESKGRDSLTISSPGQPPKEGAARAVHNRSLAPAAVFLGVFIGDGVPFGSIVRNADAAKCSVRKADWKGTNCVLLEASTKSGQYRVWLDPQRGYRALHATLQKEAGDDSHGARLDRPMQLPPAERERMIATMKQRQLPTTPMKRLAFEMEVTRLQQQLGVWWPMEGDWTITWEYQEGAREVTTAHHTCTMADLAPDFAKQHAFEPTFKDGAKVRIEGEQGTMQWIGGKVVPDAGGQ